MTSRPSANSSIPLKPKRSQARMGSVTINASDLKGLRYAWRNRQLVLFLGAGISIPYGLPSWKNLILESLFEQAQGRRRLGDMWPHYRRAVASWMTDYFDYDPLVLARMVERDLRRRTPKVRESPIRQLTELIYFLIVYGPIYKPTSGSPTSGPCSQRSAN